MSPPVVGLQRDVFVRMLASPALAPRSGGSACGRTFRDAAERCRRPRAASGCICARRRSPSTRAPASRSPSVAGQRPAQVGAVDARRGGSRALRGGPQAAHHRLDFGEFRHGTAQAICWPRMSDNPPPDRFRLPPISGPAGPARAKKPLVRAGVRERGAALRPDERSDVAGHPSGLEARFRQLRSIRGRAGPCSIWPGARATSASAGGRGGGGPALLSDINPAMLRSGAGPRPGSGRVDGDHVRWSPTPRRLPLPDRCSGSGQIAFGLRNCTDKDAVLARGAAGAAAGRPVPLPRILPCAGRGARGAFTMLGPSGCCRCSAGWSRRMRESYRYLAESIRIFPDQETLAGDDAGGRVRARGGTAT